MFSIVNPWILSCSCSHDSLTANVRCRRQETSDEELKRAEKAILDGITRVEKKVQSLIDEEVDILFPHGHDHKQVVTESTKQAVTKVTEQVKTQAQRTYFAFHCYVFLD